jgi:hypothetical protein
LVQNSYKDATIAFYTIDYKGVAPQSGRVSNFCGPIRPLIEPVDGHCFQSDPCELLARVHDRHPVWTPLELAKGAQGNFRVVRSPSGGSPANYPKRGFRLGASCKSTNRVPTNCIVFKPAPRLETTTLKQAKRTTFAMGPEDHFRLGLQF